MDSFSNKDELRNNNWRNADLLLKSGAKFSLMSDHPITLQRTMFFTLRHLLRFGLSRPSTISKITSEAAEILGIPNIGQIRPGFKHLLLSGTVILFQFLVIQYWCLEKDEWYSRTKLGLYFVQKTKYVSIKLNQSHHDNLKCFS
jgi:hypothetical protein